MAHLLGVATAVALGALAAPPEPDRSCATFLMARGDRVIVGHNLDEAMAVPGLLVVNPRGLAKENRTFDDVESSRRSASARRLGWVSRYGSLTYNVFGRELPDGGANEAGLYVGEMTLLSTSWPKGGTAARMYHHQWIQYLLDSFATVDEALQSLERALPEGHCRWHFFLADRGGRAAVVEFSKAGARVYHGEELPYPILCNDAYAAELLDLRRYAGFGGARDPAPRYENEDPRFRWAAVALAARPAGTAVEEQAFDVLRRLDLGTTKWSVVHDLVRSRVWFRTSVSREVKWVDLSSFDLTCTATPMALDVHTAGAGDVSGRFAPLGRASNEDAIRRAWAEIDAGFFGNLIFKPRMVRGQAETAAATSCATSAAADPRAP